MWKASVIGDAYMLVGNLNDNSPDHVDQMIDLAMRMHQAAAQVVFRTGCSRALVKGMWGLFPEHRLKQAG